MVRKTLPSHYETLRLNPRASHQRVRQAYRRMAQKFHPDRYAGPGDSADLMARINLAYAVLSDPEQRAAYDAMLQPAATGHGAARSAAMAAAFIKDRFGWSGWLLLVIASVAVLTLGFVTLKTVAPERPVLHSPVRATAPAAIGDFAPLAPLPGIQPWVEPAQRVRVVNESTEPVARLLRDGVVAKQPPRGRETATHQ